MSRTIIITQGADGYYSVAGHDFLSDGLGFDETLGVVAHWLLKPDVADRPYAAKSLSEKNEPGAAETLVKVNAWIAEAKPLLERGGQAESQLAALRSGERGGES
jgi:hypothetical protein